MATHCIKEAFGRYGAKLKNVQWSVSAWAPDGTLVVSMWEYHRRKRTPVEVLVFEGSADRWSGPGNTEFRTNIEKAFTIGADIRLVISQTNEVAHIEAGHDASKVKKEFFIKEEVIGKVTEWDKTNYAITFLKL